MEGMRVVRIQRGDLFQSSAEALVNTVNTQGVMGKGLAYEFKKRFPESFDYYQEACKNGEIQIGKVQVIRTGKLHPQYIINFPTKKSWRQKSKLEYIQAGLEDLLRVVQEHEIKSIAIPPLGCGQGGLRWEEVKSLVEQAFAQLPDVEVELYEPSVPALEPVYAGLLRIVEVYSEVSPALTEQELKALAQVWLLLAGNLIPESNPSTSGKRTKRRKGLTPNKLKEHMVRAPLLDKQFFGKVPVYGLRSADLRDEVQRTLESHPEWKARVEQTLNLLDGCDSLAALEALQHALEIYQDPMHRRYFVPIWRQVHELLKSG